MKKLIYLLFIGVLILASCSKEATEDMASNPENMDAAAIDTIRFIYKGMEYQYCSDLSDADEATIQILEKFKANNSLAGLQHLGETTEYFDSYDEMLNSISPSSSSIERKVAYGTINATLSVYTNTKYGGSSMSYTLDSYTPSRSISFPYGHTFYGTISSLSMKAGQNNYSSYIYLATFFDQDNYAGRSFSYTASYVYTLGVHYLSSLSETYGHWNDRIRSFKFSAIETHSQP